MGCHFFSLLLLISLNTSHTLLRTSVISGQGSESVLKMHSVFMCQSDVDDFRSQHASFHFTQVITSMFYFHIIFSCHFSLPSFTPPLPMRELASYLELLKLPVTSD